MSQLGPQAGLLLSYPWLFQWLHPVKPPAEPQLRTIRIKGYPHPFTVRVDSSDVSVLAQVFSEEQYRLNIEGNVRLIIDCGANIGAAACYFLQRYPQAFLIAIEPDRGNAALCALNLAPFKPRVQLIRAAVWSKTCGLKIVRGEYRDGREWSTQVREARSDEVPDVEGMTLDDVLAGTGREHIDLVKIDIEAAEVEVFAAQNAVWLDRTRNLAVELHDQECEEIFWRRMRAYRFGCSSIGELTVCKNIETRARDLPRSSAHATNLERPKQEGNLGVSIVICCHNSIARLGPTLEHLAAQQVPAGLPWEVIVVDNASTDGTAAFARAHWPADAPAPLRVVDEPRLGLSAARECGFASARHGVAVFVDDDNWLCPTWVAEVERVFREHPEVGVCGGDSESVCEGDPPWWFERFATYFAVGKQGEQAGDISSTRGLVFGAGMCVRVAAWAELKSRDFRFWLTDRVGASLASGGDCELCFGLRLIGWRIWYEPQLRLKHYLPSTRLHWKYLLRLAFAAGATDTLLAPYHALLDAEQRSAPPRRPGWSSGVFRQLSLLARHPVKLLLPRLVAHGDVVQFNQNLYLGHLSALFQHRKLLREQWDELVATTGSQNLP